MLLDPRHRLVLRGVDEQPRAGLAEVLLGLPSLAQLGHGHLVQLHPGVQVGHRDPLIDYHVSAHGLKAGFQEASNVEQLYAEVRAAGPLPDVPLLILSSTRVDPFKQVVSHGIPESLLREEIEAKFRLYTDFAGSVPRGEVSG